MGKFIDLAGKTYGRLKVIGRRGTDKKGRVLWDCICECGRTKIAQSYGLQSGFTNSCGCRRAEQYAMPRSHGKTGTITYSSWAAMKTRCTNKKVKSYVDYGGRGISVCERWLSFENFLADMGERPSCAHSIERDDTNGNYEPSNCRWATRVEQNNNTRRNIFLEHNGEMLSLTGWSRRTGIDVRTLHSRLEMGWSTSDTLSIKPRYGFKRTPQLRRDNGAFKERI